jgi:hypothetical protein
MSLVGQRGQAMKMAREREEVWFLGRLRKLGVVSGLSAFQ